MGLHQRDTGVNGQMANGHLESMANGQNWDNLSNKINKTIKLEFKV